jgi:formylglycine-generating enzyme required for sulfatase activity
MPPLNRRHRLLGFVAGGVLMLCCVLPRRTEPYFRTDIPREGERPSNMSPTVLPAPDGLESFVNCIGMRMIRLPAGDTVFGSPEDEPGRGDDEPRLSPRYRKSFFISQTEVTQAEWNAVMEYNPSQVAGDRLPVQNVRVSDIRFFCFRLSQADNRAYRPPTELEWEYACRAGTVAAYNTGASLSESRARFTTPDGVATPDGLGPRPVGSYPPNAWGLHDMHGNVAECCANVYLPVGHFSTLPGEINAYLLRKNDSVFRGGSWASPAWECRSASRDHANPWAVEDTVGFRVVVEE